jgi:hypothetical protein
MMIMSMIASLLSPLEHVPPRAHVQYHWTTNTIHDQGASWKGREQEWSHVAG